MNYITISITVAALIVLYLCTSVFYEKIDVLTAAVLSFVLFIFLYIIDSALLFYFDGFSIIRTVIIIICEGAAVLICGLLKGRRIAFSINKGEAVIPIVIFLIVLPIIINKNGFYGMGQDQGVYQTKAIALINGYNSNTYTLEETESLSDEATGKYMEGISLQYGYYPMAMNNGKVEGVFHGINTYPAILAWWGSMAGYANMSGVNTLLMLCIMCLIYLTVRRLEITKLGSALAVMLYGASPIVLWVNKSTLTENITALVFTAFVYFILDIEHTKRVWLSIIPIAVFSVFHVSVYVMMPLFTVVYIVLYIFTGNKRYLVANIVAVLFYRLGYSFMMTIAEGYTSDNYGFLERIGIAQDKVWIVVNIAAVLVIVVDLILLKLPYTINGSNMLDNRYFKRVLSWTIRIAMAGFLIKGYFITKNSIYSHVNSTMYAYMAATAVIIIPFIIFILFVKTNIIYSDLRICILAILFVYVCIFYATNFSPFVIYYNYYSRYISVYISVVIILAVVLLEKLLKGKKPIVNSRVILPVYICITVFTAILYYRYDVFMVNNLDETRMQWKAVEAICNELTDKDSLVIDGDLKNQLFYTTKMMCNSSSYPVMDSIGETIQIIKAANHEVKEEGNIYVVTENEIADSIQKENDIMLMKVIENKEQLYDKAQVSLGRMPYPLINNVENNTVYLYKILR